MVGLDALQFQRLHGGGLALNFLLQAFQQFALLDDDAVQLLDLMFEVREVRLQFFSAPGMFVCHAAILPMRRREVETASGWHTPNCGLRRAGNLPIVLS